MVGSSIIKRAFLHARAQAAGSTLGLRDTEIWWQGYGGLGLRSLVLKLNTLRKVWGSTPPQVILIHCGGNDVGRYSVKEIMHMIDELVSYVAR